ncbi:DNA methylase, partial [Klebsiella pneumoniae subsp. pneumoniae]
MNRQRAAGNGIAVIPPVPSDYRSAAMSRFILGNCIDVMRGFPDRA